MNILVVDDEQDICEILKYNLEVEGHQVATANSAEEALALPLGHYDLLLLDVMMGDISGFQMAQRMKQDPTTAHIPIIFITALEGEDNLVKGLNIGADDYIAKPLSMREVKARVNAVMRRAVRNEKSPEESSSVIVHESIRMYLDAKSATMDGRPLMLTKLEFELLALFIQNPNRVFSREELLSRCWPSDVYVADRTVDVNITRLRKKTGPFGKQIKTRIGYGYIFEK